MLHLIEYKAPSFEKLCHRRRKSAVISEWVISRKFFCNVNIPRDPRGYSYPFRLPIVYEEDNRIRSWPAGTCVYQVPDDTGLSARLPIVAHDDLPSA